MAKQDMIEVEGTVVEVLPNTNFIVELETATRYTLVFRANFV